MRLPAPKPDVICRAVSDGAVLLATEQEVYYGLNLVGTYIWEHLPPVFTTLDELTAALSQLHPDIPVHTIRSDARELLNELLINGLVTAPADADAVTHAAREIRQAAPQRLV